MVEKARKVVREIINCAIPAGITALIFGLFNIHTTLVGFLFIMGVIAAFRFADGRTGK